MVCLQSNILEKVVLTISCTNIGGKNISISAKCISYQVTCVHNIVKIYPTQKPLYTTLYNDKKEYWVKKKMLL